MNWILLIVIAIFAVFGYAGWKRGVISTLISLVAMIVTILVSLLIAPVIVNSVKKNTTLFDKFQVAVYNTISNNELVNDAVDSTVENVVGGASGETLPENITSYSQYGDVIENCISQVTDKLNLPSSMATQIENIIPEDVNTVFENSVTGVKDAVVKVIAYQIAEILFNIIAYVIVFIVVYIILKILASVLGIVSMLPVIKQINKLAGLVLGIVEGLIIVWLFFAVVTFFAAEPWAADILKNIGSSSILEFLYDNDIILKSVFKNI